MKDLWHEIPNSPIAKAMRNGDGLQLITWLSLFCNIYVFLIKRATILWEGLSYLKYIRPSCYQEHVPNFEDCWCDWKHYDFIIASNGLVIIRWRSSHQNSNLWALIAAYTGEFPAQRPVTQSLDVSLIRAWINGWINNGEAVYSRRYLPHYDVTVMYRM